MVIEGLPMTANICIVIRWRSLTKQPMTIEELVFGMKHHRTMFHVCKLTRFNAALRTVTQS